MDALAALCAADIEAYPIEGWPDDHVYYGPKGMKKFASVWWDSFDESHLDAEGIMEVSDDRVVALMLQSGSHQGVRVEQRLGGVFDFDDDGLWTRVEFFLYYERALDAARAEP
jgi:hypothetical protein